MKPVSGILAALALTVSAQTLTAQYFAENTADDIDPNAPIANVLANVSDDVREFNDHVTFLAHPFLAGRFPGTQGMEISKDYMEHYLKMFGCEPAFDVDGSKSFRQPFELRSEPKLVSQALEIGDHALKVGSDWNVTSLGGSGSVTGDLTFVNYGIRRGPRPEGGGERYTNFPDDLDLSGQIAVVFRFEPMNAEGQSLWRDRGWSSRAGFGGKLKALERAGAAGVLIVNPPGCADPRAEAELSFGLGRQQVEIPVVMMSRSAGERLAPHIAEGRSLFDLRRHADELGTPMKLNGSATMSAEVKEEPMIVENVGGVLPGVGALADEWIVMGGHLDHLGMGVVGTSHRGELHPGADDNATGAAGVIMLARMLRDKCAELPEGTPRRSILFIGFTAEEQGLHGARYYCKDPIAPIEKHALMCNFDMVGRIVNKRLLVAGAFTGTGLESLLAPVFSNSTLEIVQPDQVMMASDHAEFYRADVPVLFSITADLNAHKDYHTPRDVAWKINRVDAVNALYLYRDILWETVRHAEPIKFTGMRRRGDEPEAPDSAPVLSEEAKPAEVPAVSDGEGTPDRPRVQNVRFGIMPDYEYDKAGVLALGVSVDTCAEEAGVKVGDVLVSWDGNDIADARSWAAMLRDHKPGDEVKVGVMRDGKKIELTAKLRARE